MPADPTVRDTSAAARTALFSVAAAVLLIGVKLSAGIASGSLALISEAVHSGTDLVAALLAYTALRVAGRPPDEDHPYGHGKAEHLSALVEGVILAVASIAIVVEAATRLGSPGEVTTSAWVYGTLVFVIVVDALRAGASWRASRRHGSPALAAGALHFAGDLAGTVAVLVGLILVDAGHPVADPIAAIVVAVLVFAASGTLMRRNADILLDRAAVRDLERAREALATLAPEIEVRRLRLRTAAGRHFADAVIAVAPGAALAQAHSAADAVERVLGEALPGVDAVVHMEPGAGDLGERVRAAAQGVDHVREVHNVRLMDLEGQVEASLHVKLPAGTPLTEAEAAAARIQAAVREQAPEVSAVRTHLEPLEDAASTARAQQARDTAAALTRAVTEATGIVPHDVHLVAVREGVVAYLTLTLPGHMSLAEAHAVAGRARRIGRTSDPAIVDVFVETAAG